MNINQSFNSAFNLIKGELYALLDMIQNGEDIHGESDKDLDALFYQIAITYVMLIVDYRNNNFQDGTPTLDEVKELFCFDEIDECLSCSNINLDALLLATDTSYDSAYTSTGEYEPPYIGVHLLG